MDFNKFDVSCKYNWRGYCSKEKAQCNEKLCPLFKVISKTVTLSNDSYDELDNKCSEYLHKLKENANVISAISKAWKELLLGTTTYSQEHLNELLDSNDLVFKGGLIKKK